MALFSVFICVRFQLPLKSIEKYSPNLDSFLLPKHIYLKKFYKFKKYAGIINSLENWI